MYHPGLLQYPAPLGLTCRTPSPPPHPTARRYYPGLLQQVGMASLVAGFVARRPSMVEAARELLVPARSVRCAAPAACTALRVLGVAAATASACT